MEGKETNLTEALIKAGIIQKVEKPEEQKAEPEEDSTNSIETNTASSDVMNEAVENVTSTLENVSVEENPSQE